MKIAIVMIVSIVFLFPIWWMITGSLRDTSGVLIMPPRLIPRVPTLSNYEIVLQNPLGRWGLNTILLLVIGVGGGLLVTVLAGYALGTYNFPGRRIFYSAVVGTLMVPVYALLIPHYLMIRLLGMKGSIMGAAWPHLVWGFGAIVFTDYMSRVPAEFRDSARMDGAGELRILFQVMLPIARPAIGTLLIVKSLGVMNDYIWQMLVLQRIERRTLLSGLIGFVMLRGGASPINVNPIGIQLAVGTLLFLPLLAVFLVFQRHFVRNITVGGIKG